MAYRRRGRGRRGRMGRRRGRRRFGRSRSFGRLRIGHRM